jgi:hypothetical protein
MKALIPISALAVALSSGCAMAGHDEDKQGSAIARFESLDRNNDQRLSQSEASSDRNASSKFAALDVDGDGYVTKREYQARMEKDQQDEPTTQQQRQPMPPDEPRNPY